MARKILKKNAQKSKRLEPKPFKSPQLYWAELAEILHGTLLGGSTWDSRGFFLISIWGLRYGVPLGGPPRSKILEKIFPIFSIFFDRNLLLDV